MIPAKVIDVKNRPNDIPLSKLLIYDEEVHITYAVRCLPQNVLAFSIYEKPLDESCAPYEYFTSTRFAIRDEDIQKVIDLYNEIGDALPEGVMKELLENSNLVSR